jgi:uncharacterized Tic20 family protein
MVSGYDKTTDRTEEYFLWLISFVGVFLLGVQIGNLIIWMVG